MDKVTEAAQAAYHEAAHQFGRALIAWVGRTIRASFPTATEMVVVGDMEGSEFGFRLRGVRLLDVEGHMVRDVEGGDPPALCDADAANASENFLSVLEEINPQLDWLGELEGEDNWLGEDTIDLMPLATHGYLARLDEPHELRFEGYADGETAVVLNGRDLVHIELGETHVEVRVLRPDADSLDPIQMAVSRTRFPLADFETGAS